MKRPFLSPVIPLADNCGTSTWVCLVVVRNAFSCKKQRSVLQMTYTHQVMISQKLLVYFLLSGTVLLCQQPERLQEAKPFGPVHYREQN